MAVVWQWGVAAPRHRCETPAQSSTTGGVKLVGTEEADLFVLFLNNNFVAVDVKELFVVVDGGGGGCCLFLHC